MYFKFHEYYNRLRPEDSISQHGSQHRHSASTTSSVMETKGAAKSAALRVKFEIVKQQSQ